MSNPRVVAFFDHAAVLGGGEIALCNLIERLDRKAWRPLVILGEHGPLVARLRSIGAEVEVLPMSLSLTRIRQGAVRGRSMVRPGRAITTIRYVMQLRKRLKKYRAAVLHANSLRACVLGGIAGRLAGVPVVWQIHSVVSRPMMSPAAVRLMRWLGGWLPARIICNSKATADCFRGLGDRVGIVACGADASRYAGNGRRPGVSRVGMIARISPLKGQRVFVEAAKQLTEDRPETEFILAGAPLFGEDRYADQVRQDCLTSPNPERFQLLGFVDDVPALLHDLDVVVQPSIHPEGFGLSVLEAMMAGKPVVATATGGLSELVEDHVTGRLVPPNDASALHHAIDDLLADPAAAAAMGNRARERACQRYDIGATVRALEGVYAEVAKP